MKSWVIDLCPPQILHSNTTCQTASGAKVKQDDPQAESVKRLFTQREAGRAEAARRHLRPSQVNESIVTKTIIAADANVWNEYSVLEREKAKRGQFPKPAPDGGGITPFFCYLTFFNHPLIQFLVTASLLQSAKVPVTFTDIVRWWLLIWHIRTELKYLVIITLPLIPR